MTKLTQVSFASKTYTVTIVEEVGRSITAIIFPLAPKLEQYIAVNGDRTEQFPRTTQGFKDALKIFNGEQLSA